MIKRIDKVRSLIESNYRNAKQTFTATDIADSLNIQRCDASSDLNKLYNEGYLNKYSGKPVRYSLKYDATTEEIAEDVSQNTTDHYDDLFSSSPSLKKSWQLAKTAVSYPPHGLNTIITGSTGVGKTFFAKAMWSYASENNTFKTEGWIPFVSFNCAEYSDNPQLLLSRLFGHAKGSFTGADKDKDGLIKEADGGILFLDEIHRLPPAGQEMLFTIIDNSSYRRLGENEMRHVSLMLICATTADPANVLLDTYLRRFPVHIQIPDFCERTPKERLNLITGFFTDESVTLKLPISISGECLKALVSYDCQKGNIGEMKNIINLCCAKSYLRHITKHPDSQDNRLHITPYEMPAYVNHSEHSISLPENFAKLQIFRNGITVYPHGDNHHYDKETDLKYNFDLYSYIQQKIENYQNLDLPAFDINVKIAHDLDTYYTNIIRSFDRNDEETTKMIYGIISPVYYQTAEYILKEAEHRFDRKYSRSLYTAFALHLQEFYLRIEAGEMIYNPSIADFNSSMKKEMDFLRDIRQEVSQRLNTVIPDDELGFWAKFISDQNRSNQTDQKTGIVLVCHGNQIAT